MSGRLYQLELPSPSLKTNNPYLKFIGLKFEYVAGCGGVWGILRKVKYWLSHCPGEMGRDKPDSDDMALWLNEWWLGETDTDHLIMTILHVSIHNQFIPDPSQTHHTRYSLHRTLRLGSTDCEQAGKNLWLDLIFSIFCHILQPNNCTDMRTGDTVSLLILRGSQRADWYSPGFLFQLDWPVCHKTFQYIDCKNSGVETKHVKNCLPLD